MCGRGAIHHCSRSSRYMLSRGQHTAIFIISMFKLLLLNDLLAKFIITCTLKDKLTTWLCLIEGYLTSLHDLVSLKIEHMICSRVRCITKENTIDRPSLKLIQLLPFLQNKALPTEDKEVTHLGCATVHQLIACSLLMHSEVDFVRHIAPFSESYAHQASYGIITTDCSYGICVPLVPQPQDKISNKTKCPPFSSRKNTQAYRE
jgi:hypothetical protein